MMKVLAAEMSDPQRLSRGKKYANNGSVLDIIIEPGIVTCEVQGTRSAPYITTIEVTQGSGMPLRRDITKSCNCPDDDNWDNYACKHVVATMFTLSNEFLIEPELLDTWRNYDAGANDPTEDGLSDEEPTDDHEVSDLGPARRHLRLVGSPSDSADTSTGQPHDGPHIDPLQDVLRFPAGSTLPDIPAFDPVDSIQPKTREVATILRDALANLRIEWD